MPKFGIEAFSLIQVLLLWTMVVSESFHQYRNFRDQSKYRKDENENIVTSRDEAEAVLEKYGYLRCSRRRKRESDPIADFRSKWKSEILRLDKEGHEGACDEEHVNRALRQYQRNYNLPETGELDEQTRSLMSSSRCGNKDTESEVVNPNATTKFETSSGKASINSETNESSPPAQRLRRRSVGGSKLINILAGSGGKSSLSRRRRQIQEYIDKLRVIEPDILEPLTEQDRQKRSIIVKPGEKHVNKTDITVERKKETGQMFTKEVVRWRLLTNGYSTRIPVEDQRATIDLAFRMWSEVIPPKFVEDTSGDIGNVDIEIAFGRGSHQNCPHKFDGIGGEVAHSWHTGNIHLDDEENFKSIRSAISEGIYLLRVAVHEIGHVLGLAHRNKSHSIMYAIYHGVEVQEPEFELGWEDRKAIQNIYGVCKGKFDTLFDWVRRRPDNQFIYNTYFFRGNRYWMYENHANRTRYGDPLYIAREWNGVPDSIEAYVHVWYITETSLVDEAYFFKGENYYKYNSANDTVYDGYPKKIKDGFRAKPGSDDRIPDNIDAVFFDMRDRNIYFFKDEYVYVYDPKEPEESRGCCVRKRKITEEFPITEGQKELTVPLDAVYYSYKDKAMYFFQGEDYWQNIKFHPRMKLTQNRLKHGGNWYSKWFDICDVTDMQ